MTEITQNINSMSLPENWTTTKLKDISEKITKGSTPTSYGYSYKIEGIKFIKTENIDENSNVFSTTHFIDEETNEFLKRSILHENDLLFSIAGTIGRIALIKKVNLPANTNQALAIIRILPGVISNKYLLYYLKSDAIQKKALKKIVGVGRANLSLKNVREFEVPIAPEKQQKRIVAEIEKQFSRLDDAVENLKRVKANLKRYKASVLKAAVEGKLTEEWRKTNLPAPSSNPGKFYTYAILCDNDGIYIGHTNDIERRWKQHLEGKGSKWTAKHKPVKIIHWEEFDTRKEAADREKWLKTGYGRKWIKREYAAGRTRQAGQVEPAVKLLKRILAERRKTWEETELTKMKAKGKGPKDDKWKKKYKDPSKPDLNKLPVLPSGWEWCRLEQISNVIGGLTKNQKRKSYPIKLPYLRVANVYANELRLDDIKEIGVIEDELERLLLKKGDLLIVEGNGSRDQIGRLAIWDGIIDPCVHQNHLIKVRLIDATIGSFILYFLLSFQGRENIISVASSTSGLYTLSISKVGNLSIPLPLLKEQQLIVDEIEKVLSVAGRIEMSVDKNISRAKRLRQSILAKAFSGKLIQSKEA